MLYLGNVESQTGKTCQHTFAVSLLLCHGPASTYEENETINAVRGKAAKGRTQNSRSLKSEGRQPQQCTDHEVNRDYDTFLQRWEKEGDVDPFQGKLDVDEPDEEDGQSAQCWRMALPLKEVYFFHLDNGKAHWVLFKISLPQMKIELIDSLCDGNYMGIIDGESEMAMLAVACHFSRQKNYKQVVEIWENKIEVKYCQLGVQRDAKHLTAITPMVLRNLVGDIFMSWRFSEQGLDTSKIKSFLQAMKEFATWGVQVVDSLHWKKLEQLILPTGSDHKKGWKNELLRLVNRKKLPWGDLDLMKRMLVPIHRPNHWIMAVADFEEELIAVYDSLCGNSEYDDIFKTMERSRIGDILIQQIIPVLRAQIFSVIRKGAKEEEIDSEDYSSTQEADTRAKDSRKMTPEEKHRSQHLKGTKEPALKHSTKYDHLPAQKWGAGSYVLVPVSSDPVSEAEESG
ncbi:hypothetical protein K435DRAFT_792352 [Dendrothele bispora CBS 962.96]|uniref:Ubiquitin-like protease family profile domain-containing protein n=1 Tax=Dendrothele bispora (strain CBS 962.96) TaxID=1314807 RepID=A0A4S8MIZ9_DENBC|nr:hypothetical protein K435DRAFT_792352 [Dendrothele bispora CBS 962.96]